MSHLIPTILIARGRKAGLSTRELYAALSSRQPEPSDDDQGRSDGNGLHRHIDEDASASSGPSRTRALRLTTDAIRR